MGGVGKTALALVLADRLKGRYPDAQLYLNLRGAGAGEGGNPHSAGVKSLTAAQAMEGIIRCFHPEMRLPEGEEALGPIYRSVLTEAGRVLILLDNAADAAQVRPLLPPANCLLLVTSRAHFSLPGFAARRIDCLAPEESRELLLKLAPRTGAHAAEAAVLCGQLPLALEVFAGAVNDKSLTPVPELLARLRQRKDRLAPVDAAFEVSAELLAEELRRRWTALAVFAADFDLPAAAAVWEEQEIDAARASMQALVNASLVEWNKAGGRFRLHDLVRQFCDGRLIDPEREAVWLRYAGHYRGVGAKTDELYLQGGENVLSGLGLFDRERPHIEAAFEWLRPRPDRASAALLASLVNAVVYGSDLRFHPSQRIAWLEAQRDAARLTGDRRQEGAALGNLGIAYLHLGDARKAIEYYEQRLVIAREIGDRRGEGNALGNLGIAYRHLGDARKAIEHHEQALAIDREIGDRRGEGQDLGNLGIAYADLGDARKAIDYYEQRLVIAREIGDRRGEGNALWNSADEFWKLGNRAEAVARAEAALRIYEAIEGPAAAKVRAALAEWRAQGPK